MTAKTKMQDQITHWISIIRDFQEQASATTDPFERLQLEKIASEYRGRVYAARFFDDQLGFDFDTSI